MSSLQLLQLILRLNLITRLINECWPFLRSFEVTALESPLLPFKFQNPLESFSIAHFESDTRSIPRVTHFEASRHSLTKLHTQLLVPFTAEEIEILYDMAPQLKHLNIKCSPGIKGSTIPIEFLSKLEKIESLAIVSDLFDGSLFDILSPLFSSKTLRSFTIAGQPLSNQHSEFEVVRQLIDRVKTLKRVEMAYFDQQSDHKSWLQLRKFAKAKGIELVGPYW